MFVALCSLGKLFHISKFRYVVRGCPALPLYVYCAQLDRMIGSLSLADIRLCRALMDTPCIRNLGLARKSRHEYSTLRRELFHQSVKCFSSIR